MIRLAAALCATFALATPALAATAATDATQHVSVSTAGLNLSQMRDATRMVARLDRAAASVCGAPMFSSREVVADVRQSDCYRNSMSQAVAQVNAPLVTAAFRERAPQIATRD